MESKTKAYLFTIIFLLAIILIFTYLNLRTSPEAALGTAQCNTIQFSPDNSLNIVFVGNKEKAQEYTNFIRQTSPFNEFTDSINIFNVEEEPDCELYNGIATLCHKKGTLEAAGLCASADVIVALKEESSSSIRASAFQGTISINTKINQMSVLTHELGHSLGKFAEEYLATLPREHPNCMRRPEDFKYPTDEITKECSDTNWYRPSPNSIMRSLSTNSYDTHNTILMRNALIEKVGPGPTLTGNAISSIEECSSGSEYYLIINPATEDTEVVAGCIKEIQKPSTGARYTLTKEGRVVLEGDAESLLFTDAQEPGETQINGMTYPDVEESLFVVPQGLGDTFTVTDADGQVTFQKTDLNKVGATLCQI